MVTIKLTNSKTHRKEVFEPLDPRHVRMYVCGPTVYDRAHLGNARPVVVFDVLYRLLRHVYGAEAVTYVRNFTDVDDKINAKAAETGRAIRDITDETIGWYHDDMDALGALRPNHEPRATEFIGAMIAMIEGLVAKGHAYAAEGHVLFRVRSYADYGALSGRSVDDMIAGARVEVAPFKEDPMDFVLWKPSEAGVPGWESPWGYGRPGWHIECSAMAYELLGESFDIHGGGLDLQFPHHENEIAQSACAHDHGSFAQVWLHNEMLLVEGKKMSKSLGNFFTVRDLLAQGYPGEVIRFVLLSTHYRKPMDWTAEKAREAERHLQLFWSMTAQVAAGAVDQRVIDALSDDLNTAQALSVLHQLYTEGDATTLAATMDFLGFVGGDRAYWVEEDKAVRARLEPYAEALAQAREQAMQTKDFSNVDALKVMLISAGAEVRMSKGSVEVLPTPDFDPVKLEALK
ncbi:cysteine--tRNA ligase [Pseudorhodobacter sp. MZDSW-24AT]|uniref:cysteine--tRNA ligase n=1 Tax=Pseudorhodobacter sp. MZDSW-24AT TaxID=2052957 RepID=UPI000C1DFD80|nr:cysteine--tRNA ligase [Pseudorhodobacter sp. MZDSW-24AT]PJF10897.1 cysteine--tRNA ligase [Pseudorhodobacter sp. MZDSW-24AT]